MPAGPSIVLLPGASARSAFRLRRLEAALAGIAPEIGTLDAITVHLVALRRPLEVQDQARLSALLDYEAEPCRETLPEGVLITPRPGTISPWSSKATDIVHRCERSEGDSKPIHNEHRKS